MQDLDPNNLNFYWGSLFVRSLYKQGIDRVIISPGSRSTPLTLAFAAHAGFKKTINIDERSAAFMALGMSKTDGIPTCLLCTSGTAVANYLPAIIEATQSNVPLIVLSADRPPHLRGIGASQTIDQLKIFGYYPVLFHEVGEPKNHHSSFLRLQRAALQAVQAAVTKKGVSHLNFPFSKPFEPKSDFLEKISKENNTQIKGDFSALSTSSQKVRLPQKFWKSVSKSTKPLLVAGCEINRSLIPSIRELAKVLGTPILTEAGSNIFASKYTITGFDGFLRNKHIAKDLIPDLIIRFGKDPVSKALHQFLIENKNVEQIRCISNNKISDESLTASDFINVETNFEINSIEYSSDKEWLKKWLSYQKKYLAYKERIMFPRSPLTDGYVFHTISSLISTNSFVMLSNSSPIRDMALFGEYSKKEIYVNRGTAGIDGILSTAIGISMSSKKTGVLFIGDIAFLHDSNALLKLHEVEETLIVIVLNNGGGSIFKMLPINTYKKSFSTYFETPQSVSLAALCRAHKINHVLISRPEQIVSSFESLINKSGAHIFECITDGKDSMNLRNQLWSFKEDMQ